MVTIQDSLLVTSMGFTDVIPTTVSARAAAIKVVPVPPQLPLLRR